MAPCSSRLAAHESANDFRQGGNDPGLAGRDSTQPRCAIRPSLTRRAACCRRDELSKGSRDIGRFARDGCELGGSLREARFRRSERPRRPREAIPVGARRDEASGECVEEIPGSLWIGGTSLGRSAAVQFSGETIRHRATSPAMPAPLSAPRFSAEETTTGSRSSRPSGTGRSKKNSSAWRQEVKWISGRWTRFTSSSMAADVECGCLQKSETPSVVTPRLANRSATSEQCVFATVAWSPPSQRAALTPKPAGHSCASSAGRAVTRADGLLSLSTTPSTITQLFTPNGVANRTRTSFCFSFLPIVLNSIRLNACGNSCVSSGCTIGTFPPSTNSSRSSTHSLPSGVDQTAPCVVSVLSRIMSN